MADKILQLRTVYSDGTKAELVVSHNEGAVCDHLTITNDELFSVYSNITLNAEQWDNLALFAAQRFLFLRDNEAESSHEDTDTHMTHAQVMDQKLIAENAAFLESVQIALAGFNDAGSLGLRPWMFERKVVDHLVDNNLILDTGVKVTPNGRTMFKITAKGKVEHRRITGVDSTL